MPDKKRLGKEGYQFPMEWQIPEDVESKYATHLNIQSTDQEFVINFFEAHPPIITGTEEQKKTQLEELSSVEATCVARIIVTPQRMRDFLDTMEESFEKFMSRAQDQEEK